MQNLAEISGKKVLHVIAADVEYGAHLKSRIKPLMCGVGPVESAIAITKTLTDLANANKVPDLVISLGSAGSKSLKQAEVYQATSVSYRDMDASALGFEKGVTPLLDIEAELPLPFIVPDIPTARLSTGANVISGAAYDEIDADMVDMETFAIWRACQQFNVPLIALRGISDGKSELKHLSDWTEYLDVIDEKLALILDHISEQIDEGLLG